jgi:uncharacterized repeat protein (TIGR01451 family)
MAQRFSLLSSFPAALGMTVGGLLHLTPQAIAQQAPAEKPRIPIANTAEYSYTNPKNNQLFQGTSAQLKANPDRLIDPLGRILGCGGQVLPDYAGFSVSVYEPRVGDPTGTELGNLVPLTATEATDIPGNGVSGGLAPNDTNQNPYFLSNSVPTNFRGVYNFLLDPNKGQLQPGKSYILVISPPPGSIYQQRRIKISLVESNGTIGNGIVRYVARSLDGQPISARGGTQIDDTVTFVPNAELIGLDLLALQFTTVLCQPNQVQIVKSGDRATAQPGDAAIYRLGIKNLADVPLKDIQATDVLPLGFEFLPKSVKAEVAGQPVGVITEVNGSTVVFKPTQPIPVGKVLNIAYGALLTPDAVRGSGRNIASVNGRRVDNEFGTKDGPSSHQMRVKSGLLADCGTILGRVFVDKNFDGEQQENEPGVPNAVVFMDDGNRITTDANGLFSVANVLPGDRSGVLDLSSVPGYTLAPNLRFKERNSQSRMVQLAPGGLVRMNFAVTPTFREAGNEKK